MNLNKVTRPEKKICVYGLIDPITKELKYIGQTIQGFRRIGDHYYQCSKKSKIGKYLSNCQKWIIELDRKGLVFDIIYLEYFDFPEQLDEAEKFWISYYRSLGCILLNHLNGGQIYKNQSWDLDNRRIISECTKKAMTEEVKQKMSESARKPKSLEHAKNIKSGQTKKFGSVIQDDLGNIYNSQREAAEALQVRQATIHKAIHGEIKTCRGRTLKLISGGRKPQDQIKVRRWVKKERKVILNPLVDNLGREYLNAEDAAKKLGLQKRQVFRLLSKECKTTKEGISLEYK